VEGAPYVVLGLILFAFVFFIVGSFIQDTNKKIEKEKNRTGKYRHKRSWFSDDHYFCLTPV
jgi:hypothetical protein